MQSCLITIGDELLSGRTLNSNAAFIGKKLAQVGAPVVETITIGDDPTRIAAAVGRATDAYDVVVITGGLGPTHDDITVEGVARALGVDVHEDASIRAQIDERYRRLDRAVPDGVARMALIPDGARTLANGCGTAPGLHLTHRQAHLFILPGVPREMRCIMDDEVLPRVADLPGLTPVHTRALATAGVYESKLALRIEDLIPPPESGIRLAFLPGYSGVELRLTTVSEPDALAQLADRISERLGVSLVGDALQVDLVGAVSALLRERAETVATAESCTGGLIGKLLTDRPGSSDLYLGGVVAYSNEIKENLLGVPHELLVEHGAVSGPVAEALALGARERLDSTYALAVTGVAGPGGGTAEKPVGLVFLGLADADGTCSRKLQLVKDREQNRERSAFAALDFLRRHILAKISSK